MKNNVEPKKYLFEYNLVTINILSFLILLISIAINGAVEAGLGVSFFETIGLDVVINAENADMSIKSISFWSFSFIVILFWFILHEIIHGIAYRIMGAKKENISYGVVLEKGIFYCKCNDYYYNI